MLRTVISYRVNIYTSIIFVYTNSPARRCDEREGPISNTLPPTGKIPRREIF
jgi:hypothetical protein